MKVFKCIILKSSLKMAVPLCLITLRNSLYTVLNNDPQTVYSLVPVLVCILQPSQVPSFGTTALTSSNRICSICKMRLPVQIQVQVKSVILIQCSPNENVIPSQTEVETTHKQIAPHNCKNTILTKVVISCSNYIYMVLYSLSTSEVFPLVPHSINLLNETYQDLNQFQLRVHNSHGSDFDIYRRCIH